mgnify:CR=1 FL=1
MWLLWTRKLHYYSVLVIKINWSQLIDYSKLIFVSCFANKIYLRWGTRNQPISFLSSSIVWLCVLLFIEKMQHWEFHPVELSTWEFNHRHFSYFKHSKVKLISFRQFADIKGSLVLKVVLCRQQWKRRNAYIAIQLPSMFTYRRTSLKRYRKLISVHQLRIFPVSFERCKPG